MKNELEVSVFVVNTWSTEKLKFQSTLKASKASRTTTIFYFNPQFEAQKLILERIISSLLKPLNWKNKKFLPQNFSYIFTKPVLDKSKINGKIIISSSLPKTLKSSFKDSFCKTAMWFLGISGLFSTAFGRCGQVLDRTSYLKKTVY